MILLCQYYNNLLDLHMEKIGFIMSGCGICRTEALVNLYSICRHSFLADDVDCLVFTHGCATFTRTRHAQLDEI